MFLALSSVLILAAADVPHTVTFVLDLRAEIAAGRFDPAQDAAGVRGGVAPLSWQRTYPAADPDGDGRYEATVPFPRAPYGGQPVTYKFKLERKGASPSEGWEEGHNRQLLLRPGAQRLERAFGSVPEPVPLSRVGTIRVHEAFPSKQLLPRTVQVWLPPGYDEETSRRYPVLYLHDGQHAFDGAEAGMEWQVDEALAALIGAGKIEPGIVVAVSNTEARRDEYTPTAVAGRGGKAALYGRFLREELKPFVDRTYRTRTDAASTALGGASHGGLVSLWLALEHPEVFGGALVLSPSAMWDDEVVVRKVRALGKKPTLRLWLDVGALEGEAFLAGTRHLRDALVAKGWTLGEDLRYLEQEHGQHDEISWASRVPEMLRFLWGKKVP